ncbi:WD repeat-containing protein WRAP73 [Amphibalanus amphitrite]|uniref:WD repeat-containing protein WRAP73 n=1 Tax=Amphibalanus amphitrite TaxID=1232801 RepID=A0A6A4W2Q2_AMPAM|nr:WD repeat-containing protein WRAP73 [Amphibalanus amphitrite]
MEFSCAAALWTHGSLAGRRLHGRDSGRACGSVQCTGPAGGGRLHRAWTTPSWSEWSPDSSLLLTAVLPRRAVQLWSIEQPEWRARIDETEVGLVSARWAPGSRHVLTTAALSLRVTVWSLVDRQVSYIKYMKDISDGLTFSPDGRCMAVVERRGCVDHVSLFATSGWELIKHIDSVGQDVAGLSWSPDSELFALWDGLLQSRVAVYDLTGRRLAEVKLPGSPLGVSTVHWSPSGQLLAATGFDDKVHLISDATWHRLTSLVHGSTVRAGDRVHVYRERHTRLEGFRLDLALASGSDGITDVSYELDSRRPVVLRPPSVQAPRAATGHAAVSRVLFSPDSQYVATRCDAVPECVWIWATATLSLHTLLVQRAAIRDLIWSPSGSRLALCTGGRYLFLWSPEQSSTCRAPADVAVTQLLWPDECTLLLQARDSLLFCRLDVTTGESAGAARLVPGV